MAVNDPTTNFGWDLPVDGGSLDAWGGLLNEAVGNVGAAIASVDEVLNTLQGEIDTFEADVADLDGRVLALEAQSNRPVWGRVLLNTPQSVSDATPKIITWDSEDVDKGGTVDLATKASRITVPAGVNGLVQVRAQIRVPVQVGNDDGRAWTVRIKKNGTSTVAFGRFPHMTNGHDSDDTDERVVAVETFDEVVPSDFFEVEVEQLHIGGTTAASVQVDGTFFEMVGIRVVKSGSSDLPVAPDLHIAARFVTTRADGEQIVPADIVDQSANAFVCLAVDGTITWEDPGNPNLNGLPNFTFTPGVDSSSTRIEMGTGANLGLNGPFTIFAVVDPADDAAGIIRHLVSKANDAVTGAIAIHSKEGVGGGTGDVTRIFREGTSGPKSNEGGFRTINVVRVKDDDTVEGWRDGDFTSFDSALADHAGGSRNTFIGGSEFTTAEAWSRGIFEIAVYDRALTNAERDSVEQFLADKYGITLSNP